MFCALAAATLLAPQRPSLVVILSIDQFRSDYLYRFEKYYLPAKDGKKVGGFRYLLENGSSFPNARYRHLPTATGPGHATIGTGSSPSLTGIVGNSWYDRSKNKEVYCVEDPSSKDVLTGKPGMSPKNLNVTTIGDELKLATNGRSKVVSVAIKDRASILLSGHASDDVVWYDKKSGNWTTSDWYAKNGKLPEWVAKFNSLKKQDAWRGKEWTKSLPDSAYALTTPTRAPGSPEGFGAAFPHKLADNAAFYDSFTYTPMANEFVVETCEAAIDAHQMGRHETPDLLTINFSSNDYLGHRFGPYSPEVMEMSIGTDRAVSRLLNTLNEKVGLSKVLFVLSADHGVVPVVEDMQAMSIPSYRVSDDWAAALKAKVEKALGVQAIASLDDGLIWFNRAKLAEAGIEVEKAQNVVAKLLREDPAVYRAVGQSEALTMAPRDDVDQSIIRNVELSRGADVYAILKSGVYAGGKNGTGHGTPWIYDASVPLIFAGPGFPGQRYLDASGPEDIAATVCSALGIIAPNGSIGKALGPR